MDKKLDEILAENSLFEERFNSLSSKNQDVLKILLGYGDEAPKTYKEAAEILNLTENRVRQIANISLRKILGTANRPQRTRPLSDIIKGDAK